MTLCVDTNVRRGSTLRPLQVCSTVACGMGIDKGDIRCVVINYPSSPLNLTQLWWEFICEPAESIADAKIVIHFDMPKSFEGGAAVLAISPTLIARRLLSGNRYGSWAVERAPLNTFTGRAGRDGQASKCILYYCACPLFANDGNMRLTCRPSAREDAIRVRKLQSLGREQRVAKVSLNGGKDPDKQARKSLKAVRGTKCCRST